MAKTGSGGGAVVPAKKGAGAVADLSAEFLEDAGKGTTNIDADSVAIPFLAVLQKNSPQCDPDQGEYIKAAKPGMLFNTVTKELFDGREGLDIVPCEYQRKFLRWAPRERGGGFRGELKPEEVVRMRERGELVDLDNRLYVAAAPGAKVDPAVNDKVADTRVHYVLVLNPRTGQAQQAVLSLASTQIKKSKQLMSNLTNVQVPRPSDGVMVTPPTFANVVHLSTVPESNEKGNWSGVKLDLNGAVGDRAVYHMARAFHKLVNAGRATVNFEGAGPGDGSEPEEGRGW